MDKLGKLEGELEKYEKKLRQLESDWAASKGGSRYGDEYLETQIKVYRKMMAEVREEIMSIKNYELKKKNL